MKGFLSLTPFVAVSTRVVLPQVIFQPSGTSLVIPCNTTGSPVATNRTWVQFQEPDNMTVFLAEDTLVIPDAQPRHSGRYHCFADNGLTNDIQSTEVVISGETPSLA